MGTVLGLSQTGPTWDEISMHDIILHTPQPVARVRV